MSLPLAKWSGSLGLEGYMPMNSERHAIWPINSRLRRAVSMMRLKKSGADLLQNEVTQEQAEEEEHGYVL